MIILGLNIFHGDSSACLIVDGKIISAVEEERFTRIKHFSGFPINSINYCLSKSNLTIEEVDSISVNFNSKYNFKHKIYFMFKNFFNTNFFPRLSLTLKKNSINNIIYRNYNKKINIKPSHIAHHKSHIASSYLCSGFNRSIGFSFDGAGDFSSTEIYLCEDNKFNLIEKVLFPHSLGVYYQAFTQFLGFKNYGEEYKVMGLAAYGSPKYKNRVYKLLDLSKKDFFRLDLKYYSHYKETFSYYHETGSPFFDNLYSSEFEKLFGPSRKINEPVTTFHKDLASSMQEVLEELVISKLNKIHDEHNIDNLCLAGGCAFNSSLNGKILNQTKFKNVYISPNVGDAGGAIGSALVEASLNEKKFTNLEMTNPFLGPEFSNDYIKKNIISIVNKNYQNIYSEYFDNFNELIEKTSELLINKKIIGWFQDRMEWGPRALGNRSILADPRLSDVRDIINLKIKRREEFRPFAPSILKEFKDEYFEIGEQTCSPFMTMVVKAKNKALENTPGVVHIDRTSRVQTVDEEFNPKFYSLIKSFYNKTKVPLLLNTSLNVNGPISRDPDDAFEVFSKTNMDVLVLQNWILIKN
jgi:carbamoyltransferase